MHLFVSAGEPSGDLHGANLVRALKARDPGVRVTGFGGDRMAAAGADLLYPLTELAVMGVRRVVRNIRTFVRLGNQARQHFEAERPDAVVLIDYPGFHFALAKRAKALGIPVYFFVPPQLWAWAGWRVRKVRRYFAGVLTALPFEDDWFRARGVHTHYVGHPYFDELAAQRPDPAFLADQRARPGRVIGLLPGSRDQEVIGNFRGMLASAARVHAARPDARFLVAAFNDAQAAMCREMAAGSGVPVEVHAGRTPEIIELAEACVSVSGSVSLELMNRLKPSVIVYRGGKTLALAAHFFLNVKSITLVNLLADAEVFPEYAASSDRSAEVAGHVLTWMNHPAARSARVEKLRAVRAAVARPGACDRAAAFLLA
ncbi:MAG: lipid-A-disaccharide synthase, partial [Gemmataceae bacterium]|nr:lipid-A-disaccharide synthase [Gemmataceae bacterium]